MSKVLIKNETNICLYTWPDTVDIYQNGQETSVVVEGVRTRIIADCNNSNTTVYEEVTNVPSDFVGHKYFFDGTTWTANSDYVEPPEIDEP